MTQPTPPTADTAIDHPSTPKKAAIASLVGSALEWYDFFLYGTASALVIGPLFFPSGSALTGTLEAFATFAVGFAARPIGGLIFGHLGDRLGRKKMLIVTLLMMGLGTALIGVLPTHAQVGPLAAVLLILLRIVQGIAVGGEFGGSVLLIAEHSPRRRGFFTSFSQVGIMLGFVLSAGMFALFSGLPHGVFMSWGWRIPFLISILLALGGLIIRMRIEETPTFKELQEGKKTHRYPVLQALRIHPKEIAITVGARMAENGGSYLFLVFSLAYGKHLGMDATPLLVATIVAMCVQMATVVMWGALSDKIGRRPVYLIGSIGAVVWAFPFFALIHTGQVAYFFVALLVATGVCHGAMIGSQPALFAELFNAEVRYSAVAIGHEVAAIAAGGVAPLIATALLAQYDAYWPIAIYLVILGLITTAALAVAPETLARLRKDDTFAEPQEHRPSELEREG